MLSIGPGFFLIKISGSTVTVGHVNEWETFFSVDDSQVRNKLGFSSMLRPGSKTSMSKSSFSYVLVTNMAVEPNLAYS